MGKQSEETVEGVHKGYTHPMSKQLSAEEGEEGVPMGVPRGRL